jgi:hypothetical protein
VLLATERVYGFDGFMELQVIFWFIILRQLSFWQITYKECNFCRRGGFVVGFTFCVHFQLLWICVSCTQGSELVLLALLLLLLVFTINCISSLPLCLFSCAIVQ